jgi:hypothetical protein
VDELWLAQRDQFSGHRLNVTVDQVIFPRCHGEVAVAAVVGAERDMNVGGSRPQPRG